MKPVISIRAQDFTYIRENGCFYIDKTGFIREWWENGDVVTLITRPRRFGKTLNLSMAEAFFSNQYPHRQELFYGLSIWKEEKYRKLYAGYPVIFLSFAGIKGDTYETARESLIQMILDLYAKYRFLLSGSALNSQEKEYFDYIRPDLSDAVAAMSIHRLALCMYRYYGKKVLIFLDEYDTPFQEAYVYGYWEKMSAFMRLLLNAAFKTNPHMERSLLTGITRISRESVFSDLNNLAVISAASERYCRQFGFTEDEVAAALEDFGMAERKSQVRYWYDGFAFGSQSGIYNPWSITCFLKTGHLAPYWANSSSNALISSLIQQSGVPIKIMMEDLLNHKPLHTQLEEEIIFSQLTKKRSAIWSLLLAGGYLKISEKIFHEDTGRFSCCLELTNREVHLLFEDMIKDWFDREDVPCQE